jgi:hypothetical protein
MSFKSFRILAAYTHAIAEVSQFYQAGADAAPEFSRSTGWII